MRENRIVAVCACRCTGRTCGYLPGSGGALPWFLIIESAHFAGGRRRRLSFFSRRSANLLGHTLVSEEQWKVRSRRLQGNGSVAIKRVAPRAVAAERGAFHCAPERRLAQRRSGPSLKGDAIAAPSHQGCRR